MRNQGESGYVVLEICLHPILRAIRVLCVSSQNFQYDSTSRKIVEKEREKKTV